MTCDNQAKKRIAEEFIASAGKDAADKCSGGTARGVADSSSAGDFAGDRSTERRAVGIERDPEKLKHMLTTDIRDSIPPQVYALVGIVAARIKRNPGGK